MLTSRLMTLHHIMIVKISVLNKAHAVCFLCRAKFSCWSQIATLSIQVHNSLCEFAKLNEFNLLYLPPGRSHQQKLTLCISSRYWEAMYNNYHHQISASLHETLEASCFAVCILDGAINCLIMKLCGLQIQAAKLDFQFKSRHTIPVWTMCF